MILALISGTLKNVRLSVYRLQTICHLRFLWQWVSTLRSSWMRCQVICRGTGIPRTWRWQVLPYYRILILSNQYHWSLLVDSIATSTIADSVATHMHLGIAAGCNQLPAAIVICVCVCVATESDGFYVVSEITRSDQKIGHKYYDPVHGIRSQKPVILCNSCCSRLIFFYWSNQTHTVHIIIQFYWHSDIPKMSQCH